MGKLSSQPSLKKRVKKVLLLGSGALKIGQAGEFDYSGSQALKALKEEGKESILINPNIATIQTSKNIANKIYFLPLTPYFIAQIIKKEKPDAILLGFGGQTALNCGLELNKQGIFKKYNVAILGTKIETIEATEDRAKFNAILKDIGLPTPKSFLVTSERQANSALKRLGFPLMLRAGFSLGGLGSLCPGNKKEYFEAIKKALTKSPQVLTEEYLGGWKEVEFEIVRDKFDNCLTVCSMENIDPMGIHTGESIVIAPIQTLNNYEFNFLRQKSIQLIRHLKIVGECNIQFAVNPKNFTYRVIEVNARLSRSSALASKATGYPLAFVAAKLALGRGLHQIKNTVTTITSAFFEPALDYVVCKYPRWDLEKFKKINMEIGSEMKSVGEVMAIGRNFQECFQKAIRMLNTDWEGLINTKTLEYAALSCKDLLTKLKRPTSTRMFMIAAALIKDIPIETINKLTKIDRFFLNEINKVVSIYKKLSKEKKLNKETVAEAKVNGFSDNQLAKLFKKDFKEIRQFRKKYRILPRVKQIDTLAAEFPAKVNYLYLTYQGETSDSDDEKKKNNKAVILGSGPYSIGASVEFDWCSVKAALSLKKYGYKTIMVNCNPETVSTDFDVCDQLYFEELTLERILDINEKENPEFIVVSFGGQIANNLASKLAAFDIKILGTSSTHIDRAEDRNKFSATMDDIGIKQPAWSSFSKEEDAVKYASKIGYPVLVRPSYVLSGLAMFVAYNLDDLKNFLERSIRINKEFPLVISKFIEGAKEIEMDGVAADGNLVIYAIGEHIENAGVHSGDATIVVPPQKLYFETLRKIKAMGRKIVNALKINGPFNIQFIAKDEEIKVIECNLRASRSFPFVSKVTGYNFIDISIKAMLGMKIKSNFNTIDLDHMGVKVPQFSFSRLTDADPVLRVEMASTGEAACLGEDFLETYLKALLAVDFVLPKKNILLCLGGLANKVSFLKSAKILYDLGYKLFATHKTNLFLKKYNIDNTKVYKVYEYKRPNVVDLIKNHKVDLVINLSQNQDLEGNREIYEKEESDGYLIRRAAADFQVPLLTNLENSRLLISCLSKKIIKELKIKDWNYYCKKALF